MPRESRKSRWNECRPVFEQWAAEIGVTIEGHTVVDDDGGFTVTAYGRDQAGKFRRNSVVVTREVA